MAGSVEKGSEHPVGAAILARAREDELGFRQVDGFRAIGGLGVEATIDGTSDPRPAAAAFCSTMASTSVRSRPKPSGSPRRA